MRKQWAENAAVPHFIFHCYHFKVMAPERGCLILFNARHLDMSLLVSPPRLLPEEKNRGGANLRMRKGARLWNNLPELWTRSAGSVDSVWLPVAVCLVCGCNRICIVCDSTCCDINVFVIAVFECHLQLMRSRWAVECQCVQIMCIHHHCMTPRMSMCAT